MKRPNSTSNWIVTTIGLLVVLGACGVRGSVAGDREPESKGVNFAARDSADLGGGWTIAHCEGDAPLFCIAFDGELRGALELLEYDPTTYTAVKNVLRAGGTNDDALRALAADFQETFEKDRPIGCGSAYTVARDGPKPMVVAGTRGIVYGFTGRQAGKPAERALQFATITNGKLHLIATSAVVPGTCLDDGELPALTVEELDDVQPALERLIAASVLP